MESNLEKALVEPRRICPQHLAAKWRNLIGAHSGKSTGLAAAAEGLMGRRLSATLPSAVNGCFSLLTKRKRHI